jgi:small subunit ribosomal protein S16
MGKKKQPHYRIVVADSRAPRDGRFVENLGHYNPVPNPARLVVDLTRVDYWLGEGAIPSPTVGNLVSKARSGGDDTVALGESVAAASAAASAAAAAVAEDDGADAVAVAEDDHAEAAAGTEDDSAEAPAAEAAAESA